MIRIAHKLKKLIDDAIEKDQGAEYRRQLGLVINDVSDAYDPKLPGFRSHFGVSSSGRPCSRELWYSWRWVELGSFPARILRLFNRGHLEEARFVAALRMVGIEVYQADQQGKQYRVSLFGGHYGSAIDGVGLNIPDLPDPSVPALLEFKTHNDKSFKKLQSSGIKAAKHEHYVQMTQYMEYWDLQYGLYGAVNKNDDDLYWEIIHRDEPTAAHYANRSHRIIFAKRIPARYSDNPSDFQCTYCGHRGRCHYQRGDVARNCRTCSHSEAQENGTWVCMQSGEVLDKAAQERACPEYDKHPDL